MQDTRLSLVIGNVRTFRPRYHVLDLYHGKLTKGTVRIPGPTDPQRATFFLGLYNFIAPLKRHATDSVAKLQTFTRRKIRVQVDKKTNNVRN